MKSKRFFRHTKGQKQFLLLSAILCLLSFLIRLFPSEERQVLQLTNENFEKYKKELDSLERLKPSIILYSALKTKRPNLEELLDSKLDSSQAKIVLAYCAKDLFFKKHLYQDPGIPKAWVAHQKMAYDIKKPKYKKEHYFSKFKKTEEEAPVYLDLNTADTSALIKVKGIGLKSAIRIINFRVRLGGFVSIYQLEELNLFEWDSLKSKEHFYIEGDLERRDINTLNFKELSEHPYISYKLAKSIIEFRERRRSFKKIEEIRNIQLIDDVLFSKIALYFKVE